MRTSVALVLREDGILEYRWTSTGTSAETGKSVRVPGFEEWTIAPGGLIAESHRTSIFGVLE